VITADSGKPMGKITTVQEFFDYLGNNRPPESVLPFIPLIIDLYKLLKVISDALIEWRFLRRAGVIYAQLFCHNRCHIKAGFEEKSKIGTTYVTQLIGYQMLSLYVKKRSIFLQPKSSSRLACEASSASHDDFNCIIWI